MIGKRQRKQGHSQSQYNIHSKSLYVHTSLCHLSFDIVLSSAAENNYVQKVLIQMEAKSENNTTVAVAVNAQHVPTNTHKGTSLPKLRNASASTGIKIKLFNSSYYTAEDEGRQRKILH